MDYIRKAGVFLVLALIVCAPVFAAPTEEGSPEELARRSHELSLSDVIYQQEDFRALYHQNMQIIELLREIRDEMRQINTRAAKETTAAR